MLLCRIMVCLCSVVRWRAEIRIFDCEDIVSAHGGDITDDSIEIVIFPDKTIATTVVNTYYDVTENSCPPGHSNTRAHPTVTANSPPPYSQRIDRTRPLPSRLVTPYTPCIYLLHSHHGSQRCNRIVHYVRRHNKRFSKTIPCHDPLLP